MARRTIAGLAVCHLVPGTQAGIQAKACRPSSTYELVVEYDFILALGAGRNLSIHIPKIADFIFWLRDECGFRFGLITADQYQSDMLLQTFQGQRIETDHRSVDRDKSVYEAWRNAVEAHQIRLYRQEAFLQEAEFLQELDRKFDHPYGGTKDLTDAAAGSYFNTILSGEKATLSAYNAPALYGLELQPVGHDAALMDFGFYEDYMRRNPRRVKVFQA